MKRLILFLAILVPALANATNEVNITVSGSGTDKETAVKVALRSALEQTYGTFVATNTKVLNDKLVSDEIVSLSRGNIKSYSILSEEQLTNGHWYMLLNVVVNINQLVSYVHGQGSSVEVDMDAFSAKVQMEELNRKAERIIIENLIAEIEAIDLWDYSLELDEPSLSGDKFVISGIVNVKYNANTIAIVKMMQDIFSALDMNNQRNNIVSGGDYYAYVLNSTSDFWIGADFPYEHEIIILRNKYNNGLFNYSEPIHSRGFLEPNIPKYGSYVQSKSLFISKIRFGINPIGVKVSGTYFAINELLGDKYSRIESDNCLTLLPKETCQTYVYRTKTFHDDFNYNDIGDTIFKIHFKKAISREEAMKIDKVTIRPL